MAGSLLTFGPLPIAAGNISVEMVNAAYNFGAEAFPWVFVDEIEIEQIYETIAGEITDRPLKLKMIDADETIGPKVFYNETGYMDLRVRVILESETGGRECIFSGYVDQTQVSRKKKDRSISFSVIQTLGGLRKMSVKTLEKWLNGEYHHGKLAHGVEDSDTYFDWKAPKSPLVVDDSDYPGVRVPMTPGQFVHFKPGDNGGPGAYLIASTDYAISRSVTDPYIDAVDAAAVNDDVMSHDLRVTVSGTPYVKLMDIVHMCRFGLGCEDLQIMEKGARVHFKRYGSETIYGLDNLYLPFDIFFGDIETYPGGFYKFAGKDELAGVFGEICKLFGLYPEVRDSWDDEEERWVRTLVMEHRNPPDADTSDLANMVDSDSGYDWAMLQSAITVKFPENGVSAPLKRYNESFTFPVREMNLETMFSFNTGAGASGYRMYIIEDGAVYDIEKFRILRVDGSTTLEPVIGDAIKWLYADVFWAVRGYRTDTYAGLLGGEAGSESWHQVALGWIVNESIGEEIFAFHIVRIRRFVKQNQMLIERRAAKWPS